MERVAVSTTAMADKYKDIDLFLLCLWSITCIQIQKSIELTSNRKFFFSKIEKMYSKEAEYQQHVCWMARCWTTIKRRMNL